MTLRRFHNALRILLNLDCDVLERAGVIAAGDGAAWVAFQADPYRWFIRADDETADKLWDLIEARQPAGVS